MKSENWNSGSVPLHANLELFETYRRIWLGTAANISSENFDPHSAWEKVSAQIQQSGY